MRQSKRGIRRERTRLDDFEKLWTGYNLPVGKTTNIVNLKVQGLTSEISLDELYAVLYNYLKHRG